MKDFLPGASEIRSQSLLQRVAKVPVPLRYLLQLSASHGGHTFSSTLSACFQAASDVAHMTQTVSEVTWLRGLGRYRIHQTAPPEAATLRHTDLLVLESATASETKCTTAASLVTLLTKSNVVLLTPHAWGSNQQPQVGKAKRAKRAQTFN